MSADPAVAILFAAFALSLLTGLAIAVLCVQGARASGQVAEPVRATAGARTASAARSIGG